jgi:hypothetical protein
MRRCRICQIPLATKIVYSESAFGLGEKFGPGEKSDQARKLTQERSGDGASGLERIRIWGSGCASLVPLHLVPYKVVHRVVDETAKMPLNRMARTEVARTEVARREMPSREP